MSYLSPEFRRANQRLSSPLSSPLRSSNPGSPSYREVLSPSRPASVHPFDPEPGDYTYIYHTLAPHMGNVARGADWHIKVDQICQTHGSTRNSGL